jgi:apolipoprotein N-acyltransferase
MLSYLVISILLISLHGLKRLPRKYLFLLSILTGLLLTAGWPAHGFPLFLLFAFCPLLVVEHFLYSNKRKRTSFYFFGYSYLAMLIWNGLTTWWVCNSTIVGGIMALVFNSFFMSGILLLFHIVKRRINPLTGYTSLPILWLAFEYIHLNWPLSWPWLTLGFGFSNYVSLLQWYTVTGPLGGSLWILLCNIAFFSIISRKWLNKDKPLPAKLIGSVFVLVALPIILSILIHFYYPVSVGTKTVKVVIVQPNIDPYNEKFSGDFQEQLKKMLALADTKVDSTTAYLIFPETALTDPDIWENNLQSSVSIRLIWDYLHKHPNLRLLTGAGTAREYQKGDIIPESAHKYVDADAYYDDYNTALQLDSSKKIQIYHKSKLVPGVEYTPSLLSKLAVNLGGTSGTLGTQTEPSVFYSSYSKTTIAPAICYESIYGGYIGEYVRKGAQLIFIITNDGWWQDTPGYRQHLCYGAMLAVETRRQVVQCANTGYSAIINEKGDVLQRTNWWEPAVIKASLYPSNGFTFYALHGDYLGFYACILSALLLIFLIIAKIRYSFQ